MKCKVIRVEDAGVDHAPLQESSAIRQGYASGSTIGCFTGCLPGVLLQHAVAAMLTPFLLLLMLFGLCSAVDICCSSCPPSVVCPTCMCHSALRSPEVFKEEVFKVPTQLNIAVLVLLY